MTDRYAEYEWACERIRERNADLLPEFGAWLAKSGLSEKRVREHERNIDLYINHYLLYEEIHEPADGVTGVGMYLGFWFIRKVSSSEWSIRNHASSLAKFYTFMAEKGSVSEENVRQLHKSIKAGLPGWLATARRHAG